MQIHIFYKQAVFVCFAAMMLCVSSLGFAQEEAVVAVPERADISAAAVIKTGDKIPMSPLQQSLYRDIFTLQEGGNWDEADAKIAQLNDHRLLGFVMHQRYMHPVDYRSRFAELKSWLALYHDQSGAHDVYDLAMARKFESADPPQKPTVKRGLVGGAPSFSHDNSKYYKTTKNLNATQKKRAKALKDAVYKDLKCCGAATRALGRLQTAEAKELLDNVEIDILKGRIANSYFYLNRTEKAFATGSEAADRSGVKAPLGAWIAGLAAWRMQDYEAAVKYFEIAANSKQASGWIRSASAFWTSRAYLRVRQPQKVNEWLKKAAAEPRTFYGLIARKALGMDLNELKWNVPSLNDDHIKAIQESRAGFRAILLMDVGQRLYAEQELMQIHPKGDVFLEEALLAYASEHKLPALQIRMATALKNPQGGLYDTALYPEGDWGNHYEKMVDKALVHALIRQESKFDPFARSYSDAQGLMQLLPSTASFISGEKYTGKNRYKLLNPELNVYLGQKYIRSLLKERNINNNLFKMVISYNAGPGNMNRWWREVRHNEDPLFFIESIPVAETRSFVERVMTNYWLYRMRFGQDVPSLVSVMEGDWPIYEGQDE